jgi:hypothetical protein
MNETRLLTALQEYGRQLEEHLAAMRERHERLEVSWVRLREIYEGEGAQMFRDAFDSASRRLHDYSEQGGIVGRQLQAKIEDLRSFEEAGPER